MFLDPNAENVNPTIHQAIDDPSSVLFFEAGKKVGDYGTILMTAQTITSNPISPSYFMLVKLPSYLTP